MAGFIFKYNEMNRQSSFIFFLAVPILSLTVFSCNQTSTVRFNGPQPINNNALARFPSSVLGKYQGTSEVLLVAPFQVLRSIEFDVVGQRDSVRSSCQIKGDSIADGESGKKFRFTERGDSIYWRFVADFDTMFSIERGGVLKKFKGRFFLNSPEKIDVWEVKTLAISGKTLSIGQIIDSADIAQLKELTGGEADTSTIFAPTRKQFRQYVKKNGFNHETHFYKIP